MARERKPFKGDVPFNLRCFLRFAIGHVGIGVDTNVAVFFPAESAIYSVLCLSFLSAQNWHIVTDLKISNKTAKHYVNVCTTCVRGTMKMLCICIELYATTIAPKSAIFKYVRCFLHFEHGMTPTKESGNLRFKSRKASQNSNWPCLV